MHDPVTGIKYLYVIFKNTGYDSFSEPYRTIRLVGNNRPWRGLVEVYHNFQWGAVCGDGWDDNDAAVVCRQLGYTSVDALGGMTVVEISGTYWLNNVPCAGAENSLEGCYDGLNPPWNTACDSSNVARVTCNGTLKAWSHECRISLRMGNECQFLASVNICFMHI